MNVTYDDDDDEQQQKSVKVLFTFQRPVLSSEFFGVNL